MSTIDRKLASIRKVSTVSPIEGADSIECLSIDGWKVVSGKGNFKPNDLCVFFEVDSYLPIKPKYEFLRKSCFRNNESLGEGFRLKTIKLRGQISQGLALPLSEFTDVCSGFGPDAKFKEGDDVTELLEVKKWEPLVKSGSFASGKIKSNWPYFIPKTDQERIQNIYNNIPNDFYEISLKLDGTSMTCYVNNDKIGVCSRNYELNIDEPSAYTNAFCEFKESIKSFCNESKWNLAFQGELMGPGIQSNRENLEKLTYFIYDIYDIDLKKYISPSVRQQICSTLSLNHVPILHDRTYISKDQISIENFLKMAEGSSILPNVNREGIVFKKWPLEDKHVEDNFTFKVISNTFLLNEK